MKKKVYTYRNVSYNKSLKVIDIPYGTILPLKNKKGGVLNQDNKFISLSYHDGEWFKLGGKYNGLSWAENMKKRKSNILMKM